MRISYTFRNMESSDGIKNYASEKIGKVQKYMRVPLHAEFCPRRVRPSTSRS